MPSTRPFVKLAIVHDYLTQRGGAERVVLSMARAFPSAPIYTSLFHPEGTFPEFGDADVRPLGLNRSGLLRRSHRLALPFLASAFSRLRISADVVLCSSSGWAHGVRTPGRKVVYCHSPARWLYQTDRYLGGGRPLARAAMRIMHGYLSAWDQESAASASSYLTNSSEVRRRIRKTYGIDAEVLPPPPALHPEGKRTPVPDLDSGFVLCVSRLLPYKNVGAVVEALRRLSSETLVVVGVGPEEDRLRSVAPSNVRFVGAVSDDELRWLYGASAGLVSASHEDYGLTPLEAAAFGKASAALRRGGFLDTVVEERTGVFFDEPEPRLIADAITMLLGRPWDQTVLEAHADSFSESRFIARLRDVIHEKGGLKDTLA